MALEVEKKYKLTATQRRNLLQRLSKMRAKLKGTEFEENILYRGEGLDPERSVLRLRKVGEHAILTYKERFPGKSSVKQQQEDETEVADAEALDAILQAIGFEPALIYEKRRMTWHLKGAEVVLDELPFGQFMEIEASGSRIREIERELAVKGLKAENATYPSLTIKHGRKRQGVVEARFDSNDAKLPRQRKRSTKRTQSKDTKRHETESREE
jgi:adenylate cyclase class 2